MPECDGLCFEVPFLYLELDHELYLRHSVVKDVSPLQLDALWGDVKTLQLPLAFEHDRDL